VAADLDQTGEGLVVDRLVKSFGERQVVRGVSLRLRRGEVAGLLGPNGAGQDHLFRTWLIRPDPGYPTAHREAETAKAHRG